MPRIARIDIPGLLYHVIARGINRQNIFLDYSDYDHLFQCIGAAVPKYKMQCFAWTFLPNHIHLLVRAGSYGLAAFMRSLLTSHASYFNRKYKRVGHLFQNRYKSIICEESAYFLELVRYIHFNPVRAGIVACLEDLKNYPWSGHQALLGIRKICWQDTFTVLAEFASSGDISKQLYLKFLQEDGAFDQSADSCIEIKSAFADDEEKQLLRQGILGNIKFAEQIFRDAENKEIVRIDWKQQGIGLVDLVNLVADKIGVSAERIMIKGRQGLVSEAKALVVYLGIDCLGKTVKEMAEWTKMSISAASKARWRGNVINDKKYRISLKNELNAKVS